MCYHRAAGFLLNRRSVNNTHSDLCNTATVLFCTCLHVSPVLNRCKAHIQKVLDNIFWRTQLLAAWRSPNPALPPPLPHMLLQYLCFKIVIISIYLCTDTVPSSYLTDVCVWLRDGSPLFTAFSVCTDSLTDISPRAEQSAALIRSWFSFKVENELRQDHSCC